MNAFRLLLFTALVVTTPALAQQAARPSAAAKELGFYVGRWTSHGGTRNAATEPWIPIRTWETCSWVIAGNAVECRETSLTSTVRTHGIYLLAYDSLAKQFTVYGIDDTGMQLSGVGSVEPGTGNWSWTLQMKSGEKTTNWRYEFVPTTRNKRSMTLLIEDADGKWTPMTNAVYTRAK